MLRSLKVDPYIVGLVLTVAFACVFPAHGAVAVLLGWSVKCAVGGLFFVYGAKLSTSEVITALHDWKPQSVILGTTFVVFPLLGLGVTQLFGHMLDSSIATGFIFLSVLPSTVQSSIAFTSIAGGNVAAALCAASVSNLLGVVATPFLTSWLIAPTSGSRPMGDAIMDIAIQILIPFLLGQGARRWVFGWIDSHRRATLLFDRGSILLVVYSAFSAGMLAGVWSSTSWRGLAWVLALDACLLAVVLCFTHWLTRALRFDQKDRIAIVFCGSKKSMASGIPMANVLFPAQIVSIVVLPLMLFHQLQLLVCAFLAERYAERNRGVS